MSIEVDLGTLYEAMDDPMNWHGIKWTGAQIRTVIRRLREAELEIERLEATVQEFGERGLMDSAQLKRLLVAARADREHGEEGPEVSFALAAVEAQHNGA